MINSPRLESFDIVEKGPGCIGDCPYQIGYAVLWIQKHPIGVVTLAIAHYFQIHRSNTDEPAITIAHQIDQLPAALLLPVERQ